MSFSEVYFSSLKNPNEVTPLNKITRLLKRCGIQSIFNPGELVAVKLHFGELGNTAFLRPVYLRPVIEILKELKTKPFLTDTNTLYIGMRANSVDHLHNAMLNGFNYSTLQVPVIIADGLRGENTIRYPVDLPVLKELQLAADILNADGMVMVSHFKGHEISGFGGAVKNLSMGCASRGGKMDMHSDTRPYVSGEDCTACKRCISQCQVEAIEIKEKAVISDKCVGCSRCIAICPEKAIRISWSSASDQVQKKMVEYAYGVMQEFQGKAVFLNTLTDITPACDCYAGNTQPVVGDIGFMASSDPVALDKASFDLVIQKNQGKDPFKEVYPAINTSLQLTYAAELNFGKQDYKLVSIE